MTLGKSLHHFSVTPLSWVIIKGTFYLTNPIDLWIHKSLLSHFQSYLHLQLSNRNICIWMDIHGRCKESGEFPALFLLEITTAATGVSLPLWEIEDKKPRGSSSLGKASFAWGRRSLAPTLDELALLRTVYCGALNSTQVDRPSRNEQQRKKESFILVSSKLGQRRGSFFKQLCEEQKCSHQRHCVWS